MTEGRAEFFLLGRLETEQQLVGLGDSLLEPIAAFEEVVVELVAFFLEGEGIVESGFKGRTEVDVEPVLTDGEPLGES